MAVFNVSKLSNNSFCINDLFVDQELDSRTPCKLYFRKDERTVNSKGKRC